MKLIFLDMDGVMNSVQSAIFYHDFMQLPNSWFKEVWRGKSESIGYRGEICPYAVSNLRNLLEDFPETKIVISSTWRLGNDTEWFNWLFNEIGLIGNANCQNCDENGMVDESTILGEEEKLPEKKKCRFCDDGTRKSKIPSNIVIDRTPLLRNKDRGEEIQQWMDDNPDIMSQVDSFVILDDDSDMAHFTDQPCFIQTDNHVGFDYNVKRKVKNYLGGYNLTEHDVEDGKRYRMSCKPDDAIYYWDGKKHEPYYYREDGELVYATHFPGHTLFAKV